MRTTRTTTRFWGRRLAALGAATALAIGLGGCQDTKIKAMESELGQLRQENDQLNQQNRLLNEQVATLQTKSTTTAVPGDDGMGGSRKSGGNVVISVAGDVLFDSGKTTVKQSAKSTLNKIASDLNGKYDGHSIRIEGHTDSDPIRKSKWESNEALSRARADAVEQYLSSQGVDAGRMSTVGKGSSNPKGSKAASRRVEIVVVGGG